MTYSETDIFYVVDFGPEKQYFDTESEAINFINREAGGRKVTLRRVERTETWEDYELPLPKASRRWAGPTVEYA